MRVMGAFVHVDGEWIAIEDAKLSFMTHSLHYGLTAFEGIRCYQSSAGPRIFRLEEHMKRFLNSCKIVDMPLDQKLGDVMSAVVETVRINGHKACYIRPLAYYGDDRIGLNTVGMKGHFAVLTWEWGAYLGEEGLLKGIRVKVSSYTRHHPNIAQVRAKVSGNYINSMLAKAEAIKHGYDEALMLDPDGFVVEGTGENLFIVEGGRLITPPEGSILPGITRDSIITLARDSGLTVSLERLTRDRVLCADEVFLTGTAAELTPVREMDGRTIGTGSPGPVTRSLQDKFFKVVGGEVAGYESWLTPVPVAR